MLVMEKNRATLCRAVLYDFLRLFMIFHGRKTLLSI